MLLTAIPAVIACVLAHRRIFIKMMKNDSNITPVLSPNAKKVKD
jgi:hypothetical protein